MKLVLAATFATVAYAFQFGFPKQKLELQKCLQAGAIAASISLASVCPALAGDIAAGEQLFNANCAACHAGGQNVIYPEKTLEKEALDQYLSGGRSIESVVKQVTNGKNAMPAFGGRLGSDQIDNVASYVISQSDEGWDDDE
mmetsp:Transcript_18595/g.21396  ORF Transcript_18595/g.21396 Transcript_18595/m.21396 type:complete len:142 (+) Transcript_18595:82-507(+)